LIFLRIGAWAMGLLALLSLAVLAVGFFLPSTWIAEAEIHIDAPTDAVHPLVHRADGWLAWTPGPETGVETFGPDAGVGSGYRWDDPGYGKGEFTLTRDTVTGTPLAGITSPGITSPGTASPGTELTGETGSGAIREIGYEVEVEGGSIRIQGFLTLVPEGTGTRVTWREEGDFGWNPLLGYLSGRMAELQGEQLLQSLGTLKERVEAGGPPAEETAETAETGETAETAAQAAGFPSLVSSGRPG